MTTVNEDLRVEILALHAEDQGLLEELEVAEKEVEFARSLEVYYERVFGGRRPIVFRRICALEAWAAEPDAPDIVRRRVAFSGLAVKRLKEIVGMFGWPRRALLGDDAGFFWYFLFGHADSQNTWRRSQLPAVRAAFSDGEIPPRLFAHLVDRIEACDGLPQVFGSIMGPSAMGPTKQPGEAELFWPLADSPEVTDARRAEIGLPPMEEDLEEFRHGATIGPYMSPTRSQ